MTATRLHALRQSLATQGLAGAIISKRENIHYLTGLNQIHPKNREALLFVSKSHAILYHSVFLAPSKAPGVTTQPMDKAHPLPNLWADLFPAPVPMAIEAQDLTVGEYHRFKSLQPSLILSPCSDLVENLRLVKSDREITSMRLAGSITAKTFTWIIRQLRTRKLAQATESQIARLIDNHLLDLGASGVAFPTVVAFNAHAASPHHQPDDTRLTPASTVLMDFGCQAEGYASDMTRTIFVNPAPAGPPPRFKAVEATVLKAYQAALTTLQAHFNVTLLTKSFHLGGGHLKTTSEVENLPRGGRQDSSGVMSLTAADLDHAARSVIAAAGYGDQFIHTTGHGLGLEIHEAPSLSATNTTQLKPGMTITLEPGIYLPNQFGYRHENTILLS